MQLVKMRNSRDYAASLTVPAMRWPPRWTSANIELVKPNQKELKRPRAARSQPTR
ncbi:hypothetical protein LNQ52_22140 [Klebsiella pneumoniae subsp. pneumoniae]|nr:hypothetical protein [Klebsiella pneumoniae subsp. pneumoniae]